MRLRPLLFTDGTVSVHVSVCADFHPGVLLTAILRDLEHLDFAMVRVAPLFELLFAHLSELEPSLDLGDLILLLFFQMLLFDQLAVGCNIVAFGMPTRLQCYILVYYEILVTFMLASSACLPGLPFRTMSFWLFRFFNLSNA